MTALTNSVFLNYYRDSLQISRREQEPLNTRIVGVVEGVTIENNYSECTYAADRSASCCRSLALAVSIFYIYNVNILILIEFISFNFKMPINNVAIGIEVHAFC